MDRSEIENVSATEEMLARMWIECDPNRSGGADADSPYTLFIDGKGEDHPRWMWFLPRARASEAFLKENGFVLGRAEGR